MFLMLWYSPPEIIARSEGYIAPPSNRKIIFVLDNRKVIREDEEILLLKP